MVRHSRVRCAWSLQPASTASSAPPDIARPAPESIPWRGSAAAARVEPLGPGVAEAPHRAAVELTDTHAE
jgi:hypothetical protein